ncbi:MAG: hypothetical protein JNJ46_27520 [Myxococcales bacterium]|nr:hypothetical protein [Myxococcales bacterium]
MQRSNSSAWILAAYYWSPYLAMAVLDGERIVESVCHRIRGGVRTAVNLDAQFRELVRDYAPECVVVPPVLALMNAASATHLPTKMHTIREAKASLIGDEKASHREFYKRLTARYPMLGRLLLHPSGKPLIAKDRSRGAVRLLPIALGLAYQTSIKATRDRGTAHA